MLTQQDVKHIAKLGRLDLNHQEIEKYQAQLGEILNYVDKLQEVDTKNITTADGGIMDLENVWREDLQPAFSNQQLAKNLINMAAEKYNRQVKVEKIL